MRVVHLLPRRAAQEQNSLQEMKALSDADYDVVVVSAPYPGIRGIVWLEIIGVHKAIRAKPDIISARDLDALGAGVKVKRRTGAKLVYDMHEPYTMMVEDDMPKCLLPFIERHEQKLLSSVDLALASDEGRKKWLMRQLEIVKPVDLGGDDDPTIPFPVRVILNCRDPFMPYVPPPDDDRVCYTGTLHPSRFIKEMVEAVHGSGFALVVAGPDTPGGLYKWLERQDNAVSIQFRGHLIPDESLKLLQRSDISVQMANPTSRINRLGPYNRLFDALTVGRPSIGTTGTENANIITNLNVGITSMYGVDAFRAALKAFFDLSRKERAEMGLRAYERCVKEFNWKTESKKLVGAYNALVN